MSVNWCKSQTEVSDSFVQSWKSESTSSIADKLFVVASHDQSPKQHLATCCITQCPETTAWYGQFGRSSLCGRRLRWLLAFEHSWVLFTWGKQVDVCQVTQYKSIRSWCGCPWWSNVCHGWLWWTVMFKNCGKIWSSGGYLEFCCTHKCDPQFSWYAIDYYLCCIFLNV